MKRILWLIGVGLIMSACVDGELGQVFEEEGELFVKWECAYTIDGVQYHCGDYPGKSFGSGVMPAYQKGDKPIEEYDSLLFHVVAGFSSEHGRIKVNLLKKFAKDQLKPRHMENFYTLYPEDKERFPKEGSYPFSLDFNRFNSHEGVALEVRMINEEGQQLTLTTYSTAVYGRETNIDMDSHENSSFEIVKIVETSNGRYAEAKFEARFFGDEIGGKTEVIKEVKNGFVRFPIVIFD